MFSSILASECELVWMFWIFFFCITNISVVMSCVEEFSMYSSLSMEKAKTKSKVILQNSTSKKKEKVDVSILPPPPTTTTIQKINDKKKRKEREDTFGLAYDEIVQGRVKRRRVFKPVFLRNIPRKRTFSFGDANICTTRTAMKTISMQDLRRAVSCSDLSERPEMKIFLNQQQKHQQVATKVEEAPITSIYSSHHSTDNSTTTKLETFFFKTSRQVRGFLLANLEKAIKNAVDEIISSFFSFVTYAAIVFLVRQYCEISVGVSLDLGAFSIEL
jgi:hypothetical protein